MSRDIVSWFIFCGVYNFVELFISLWNVFSFVGLAVVKLSMQTFYSMQLAFEMSKIGKMLALGELICIEGIATFWRYSPLKWMSKKYIPHSKMSEWQRNIWIARLYFLNMSMNLLIQNGTMEYFECNCQNVKPLPLKGNENQSNNVWNHPK